MRLLRIFTITSLSLLGLVGQLSAASIEEYRAASAEVSVITALNPAVPLIAQVVSHPGQIVEAEGIVSGIVAGMSPGFLMQIDRNQTLVVALNSADTDVVVGRRLRVLARIPDNGVKLTGISVTWLDRPAPANPVIAATVPTVTPAEEPAVKEVTAPMKEEIAIPITVDTPLTAIAAAVTPTSTPVQLATNSSPARTVLASKPTEKTLVNRAIEVKQKAAPRATTAKKVAPTTAQLQLRDDMQRYAAKIRQYNPKITQATATKIAYGVLVKSPRYNIDPRLVFALLAQESRFNPMAVSPVGARGLGQLMPGTAAQLGVKNVFDIYENLEGTIKYLSMQLQRFNGNRSYALAAYNAGPGNVSRYGGIPPFRETKNYVRKINAHYNDLTVHNL